MQLANSSKKSQAKIMEKTIKAKKRIKAKDRAYYILNVRQCYLLMKPMSKINPKLNAKACMLNSAFLG
jgi:hypothetical protein